VLRLTFTYYPTANSSFEKAGSTIDPPIAALDTVVDGRDRAVFTRRLVWTGGLKGS